MEKHKKPDPFFAEEKSSILELTPPSGMFDLRRKDFQTESGAFEMPTPALRTPPNGSDRGFLRPVFSVRELVRKNVMRIVWQQHAGEKNLQIGFLQHSEALHEALESGDIESLLQALSDSYRDIYGNEPWKEYLCCSNSGCPGTRSIEDIHGPRARTLDLKGLEGDSVFDPKDFHCPVDGGSMEFFYDPAKHLQALRAGFQQKILATLLFADDHELLGFCLGWETTVSDGWQDKVIPGKGDLHSPKLSYEEYVSEALHLFGEETKPEEKVLNVAEWGIDRNVQGKGTALMMMKLLYEQALQHLSQEGPENPGVFAHSLDGSRAFQITSKIGFQWGKTLPSGERRAYLRLREAITGIDRILSGTQIKIIPVEQTASAERQIPRDTLVIEMLCEEAVGSDENGNKKVIKYLTEISNRMGLKAIGPAVTHLSPKYGLSGWLPLESGSAIHLYAWDYEDGSHPPFLSIDISTPGVISDPQALSKHAERYFHASGPAVQKNMQHREHHDWHELAPHIHRQRITISGKTTTPLQTEQVKNYLRTLAPHLDMMQLSEPLVIGNDGWMHWETSGVVLHWDESTFSIDVYTCKQFDPTTALDFTTSQLGLHSIHHKNF